MLKPRFRAWAAASALALGSAISLGQAVAEPPVQAPVEGTSDQKDALVNRDAVARYLEPSPASVSAAASGQVVAFDTQTGKLRPPTAAETAELARASAKTRDLGAVEPVVKVSPSGVKSLVLGDEYRNYAMARAGADGQFVRGCVDGSEAAKEWLENRPPALPAE